MFQALSLIAAAKASRATTLDLGNCGLTELPEALFELTWLEELILSNRWDEYDPVKKQWELKESQNKGEPNRIASIAGVEALGSLKKLVVAKHHSDSGEKWELSDLAPLSALTQLQTLSCSSTQVSDLAPLSALTQLQTLSCRNTQVSDLAPLSALTQLQTLDCRNTQVSDLAPLSALTQLQTLDCYYTQVSDLAPLSALTQLQTLSCSSTQVSDLAPLSALTQLQTLYCSSTQVSDLAPLAALTQLKTLYCSSTQVSDLAPLAALTQLKTLYCSSTQVSDLAPLAALTQLKTLDCPNTQVSDLAPLAALTQLQKLSCPNTQVSDLAPLAAMNQLQTLDCDSTQVSDLAPLAALTQLQKLSCPNTQVSDLAPLAALNQLQTLDCDSTQVSDLAPLAALTQLQKLSCSDTQVSDLVPLAALTQLQKLSCSDTQVSDLAPLAALNQLQTLDCSATQVSDLAPLAALTQLQTLWCYSTKVSDLAPLAALTQLQTLWCYSTKVSDLAPLAALTQLQTLWCYSTKVSDLAPLAALTQLQTLWCYSTKVSDLSPLKDLANLQQLFVQGCPIQNIPKEIYDQNNCAQALFTYWQELKTAQKTQNNQLKVMFLGNGCVGKSTLLHWFLNKEFTPISLEEGRTHGIFIKPYTFENSEVLAHFWDFGGQEVFHATHRLFLGRRSLYVLLWATESPEPNGDLQHPPQYWLDMIADIADRHERSRVLIVQNLFEGQKERNILSDAERDDYETRGLDITTYCVNAKTGLKVKTVMTAIEEEAQHLLNTYREELPETWVNIRAAVAERRFMGEKMLEQSDFEAICRDCQLSTSPLVMLDYLHRAGELFYYRDRFENKIILDQEWALRAVYAILKRKNIEAFKGRMRREQLVQMWQSDGLIQAKEEAKVFLNFMMANKIAWVWLLFDVKLSPHFCDVVPELFPPSVSTN